MEGLAKLPHLESVYFRNNNISTLASFTSANAKLLHLNLRCVIEDCCSLSLTSRIKSQPDCNARGCGLSQEVTHAAFHQLYGYLLHFRAYLLDTRLENPIVEVENYRMEVLMRLPWLEKIDKDNVTPEEKEEALAQLAKKNKAEPANGAPATE